MIDAPQPILLRVYCADLAFLAEALEPNDKWRISHHHRQAPPATPIASLRP